MGSRTMLSFPKTSWRNVTKKYKIQIEDKKRCKELTALAKDIALELMDEEKKATGRDSTWFTMEGTVSVTLSYKLDLAYSPDTKTADGQCEVSLIEPKGYSLSNLIGEDWQEEDREDLVKRHPHLEEIVKKVDERWQHYIQIVKERIAKETELTETEREFIAERVLDPYFWPMEK